MAYIAPMKMTRHTQQKLQDILKTLGFTIRYEKGNFNGGYCVVMNRKLIIINKFHPLEGKINTLSEIIKDLEVDPDPLTPEQFKLVEGLQEKADT